VSKKEGIDRETGIWTLEVAKRRHRFDPELAKAITEMYAPDGKYKIELAADIGCGPGEYCAAFKSYGWPEVHGYEGTKGITTLGVYDDITRVDLTKRRWVGIPYDFVLCLEVGEHIPLQYEQVFIDNLCEYTMADLVMSWAIPGQGGAGHFNERVSAYVISEFVTRGMEFLGSRSEKLRELASLKWFKNTILVFKRRD